jgi:hypothetical protein
MQKQHILQLLLRIRMWAHPVPVAACQVTGCALLWCFMLTFAAATDWQWHAIGTVGNWGHSASYSVLSSSGASCPFASVINADGISYGGFIFPYDRRVMRVRDDFDGDGKSDCWYYHPSKVWYIVYSSDTQSVSRLSFGLPNATAIPEDYDGDLLTDFAVYQENSGTWEALLSSQGSVSVSVGGFGGHNYIAVPADYDGDLRADLAVYHILSGIWTVLFSASGYQAVSAAFGSADYTALAGDFDMDDKADLIIYNETIGNLLIAMSGNSYLVTGGSYGGPGFTLLSEDYDGDGCADMAVYGRGNGLWYVTNYKYEQLVWGTKWGGGANYQPIKGDYDGDGLADVAVFYRDRRNAVWHLDESTAGPQSISARSDRR